MAKHKSAIVTVSNPALRIRVRCKEAHADPWLRRLYVLWAAPASAPADGGKVEPPKFALAESDSEGCLFKPATALDPKSDKNIPMFAGHEYWM
jgi:hypothetical protein